MDNKGEYFIRNLFDAYLNNPRQLPDITLASYCQIKRLEITKLGEKKFTDWLISKQKQYRITSHLRDDDLRKITGFLKEDSDGHDFRLLPSDLIEKLLPYLIIDNDFMRTVADYVSGMTDKFAQEEYARLYSV
jgi:dGTP triphosphohydrolase